MFPAAQLKQLFLAGVAVLLLALAAQIALSQTTVSPIPLPVPFTPVVDHAGVIDAETRERLEAIYRNLKQQANIEFAVVTVPTTGELDIFDYSLAVARGWGIGSKEGEKNGLLLLVAVKDRKYYTQVSRHLEGDLPDGVVGQIQRQRLVPQFRKANYSEGIYDTIQGYVATLAEKRGFSIEGIERSYAYRAREERPRPIPTSSLSTCFTLIVILAIVFFVMSAAGRGRGGCLQALFLGQLLSGLGGGRSDWGDWGGSGSGWNSGGFGGSSGGFGGGGSDSGFGGGGDFGGGGSGGSW